MNTYKIQHKIKTLSNIDFSLGEFDIDGYKIENWKTDYRTGRNGNARIITKEIMAIDRFEAINLFRNKFKPIAEKLSLINQCYFEFLSQSFLIEQLNTSKRTFTLRLVGDRKPVGLHFGEEELENYKKLDKILMDNPAFKYLQECINTIGYYAKTSLLCSALEALAGKEEKTDKDGIIYTTYSKNEMKKILGNKYFGKIFGHGGLRHKIQHGDFIDNFSEENYIELIYNKILRYLNVKYCLELNLDIMYPQRHFWGNLEQSILRLEPKNKDEIIDLRYIPESRIGGKIDNDKYTRINNYMG